MSGINYSEKIPNNVNLSEDRTLQRALEQWQPNFVSWWDDIGPEGSTDSEVYLRTAVSVDPQGWAQFGHVKLRDYRWGIVLNPGSDDRTIAFGDHKGEKAWTDVPGEYRANLRRIIVTQGDTEPASVEQQRHLGLTAPSMYDLCVKEDLKLGGTDLIRIVCNQCGEQEVCPSMLMEEYEAQLDDDSTLRGKGKVMVVEGQVTDHEGKPVAGAVIDAWHCNEVGGYSHFFPGMKEHELRRKIVADANGNYRFRTRIHRRQQDEVTATGIDLLTRAQGLVDPKTPKPRWLL